jgi:hypothetical protein
VRCIRIRTLLYQLSYLLIRLAFDTGLSNPRQPSTNYSGVQPGIPFRFAELGHRNKR